MKIVKNPQKPQWSDLLSRPALSVAGLYDRVQAVLDTVRQGGDQALKDYELQFDKVQLDSLAVSQTAPPRTYASSTSHSCPHLVR